MKSQEKEEVMDQFRAGELDVLVATVVIEVGVDVPEASVIVIEDAWRFGLAQLHQLRGRVGRSDVQSYCYLLGTPPNEDGRRAPAGAGWLPTTVSRLAEIDLEMRGEGTLLGARQQGRSDLRLASLQDATRTFGGARARGDLDRRASARTRCGDLIDELRLFVDDDEAAYLFQS